MERILMNQSEAISKRVLETVLRGTTMEYQADQSHGECDFDLLRKDGSIAAVEITAAVDEVLAGTVAAIRSKRKGGSVFKAKACKRSWVIFPAKGASINKIRSCADLQLAKLEEDGIERFFWVSERSLSVQELCCNLQITSGAVISLEAEPTIRIGYPVGGGAVGASLAVEAGEREAMKPDNRKKLGATRKAERHLVVYIDAGCGLPWMALTSFTPDPILPRIPVEITHLWLIGHGQNPNEFFVWFGSSTETWRSTKVVCVI
jgi:hypothetical protein